MHQEGKLNRMTLYIELHLTVLCLQVIDAEALALAQSHANLSPQVQKELATLSETVTPWWWGLKTLVKVCCCCWCTCWLFLLLFLCCDALSSKGP